jgi:hypothetical protein
MRAPPEVDEFSPHSHILFLSRAFGLQIFVSRPPWRLCCTDDLWRCPYPVVTLNSNRKCVTSEMQRILSRTLIRTTAMSDWHTWYGIFNSLLRNTPRNQSSCFCVRLSRPLCRLLLDGIPKTRKCCYIQKHALLFCIQQRRASISGAHTIPWGTVSLTTSFDQSWPLSGGKHTHNYEFI